MEYLQNARLKFKTKLDSQINFLIQKWIKSSSLERVKEVIRCLLALLSVTFPKGGETGLSLVVSSSADSFLHMITASGQKLHLPPATITNVRRISVFAGGVPIPCASPTVSSASNVLSELE